MAFDESKDKTLAAETFPDSKGGTIEVKVSSYNEGEAKMQLSRFEENDDGDRVFRKLGRLTKPEAQMIGKLIDKLIDKMDAGDTASG